MIREFPGFRVVLAVGRVRLPPNNQTGYLRVLLIKNSLNTSAQFTMNPINLYWLKSKTMQNLNRRTNLHPPIPTILPVQLLATIVQLSPSILLDWSFKISNNFESLASNQTSFANQPDHDSDSPRIVPNVIDQAYNFYWIDPILNLQWLQLDGRWWSCEGYTLIPIFHPNCIQSVSLKALLLSHWFSLDFSQLCYKQKITHIAI